MKTIVLKGKVVTIDSGSGYTDKKQRVSIMLCAGESHATIRLPNDAGFVLEQEVEVTISSKPTAEGEAYS